MSTAPHDDRPRQDADGTAYLAYFTREPIMASFAWSGHPSQPIEVAYAEAGEPVDARFAAPADLCVADTLTELIAGFQQVCDQHLAHLDNTTQEN